MLFRLFPNVRAFRLPAFRLTAMALCVVFSTAALGQANANDDDDDDDDAPPVASAPASQKKDDLVLPKQELTEPILLGLLVAEIAAQRNSAGFSAQTAKRTRDPRVAKRATEIANFARQPGLALEAARIWYAIEPGSPQALQSLGGLLISARRVDEALPYLEKLFAGDATSATNGFMQINRFLAPNPDRSANLGVVRKLAGNYPELPQAHFAIAQAAAAANNEALALGAVRRAGQLRPDWDLAAIFEAQKLPEARQQFKSLLAAHPENTDVLYTVGLLSVQLKDYDEGEAYLSKLLQTRFRDKDGVRFTLGQLAEEKKDLPAALKWYSQVESGEQFVPSRLRYAMVLSKQGKLAEAREYLRSADAGEQQVQMRIAEAQLLRDANQNTEAFKVLAQALQAQPDQPDLLYDHALTAERLEKYDILESNLNKLIKLKPDHAHAYNALGYSFAERNVRLDEAKKLIEKAMLLAPEDLFIVDSMGWIYYRMGDYPRAIEYLRRAWNGRPDGEIGAHLGEVLWVSGERAEAERIWQEAVKQAPENDALQKTIKRFKP
ncbi:MAG: tetratricopeptide repeat protein [Proteobacteria bacterium]|nr:tetratricopeptide repeat protein [Pseudomonadota bacterium]